jgi:3-deoxy-7-phosphoheptulonate synthase
MASRIKNLNVASISPLDPPSEYLAEIPITREVEELVVRSRQEIADIVSGDDDRLLVITGPCSIHDEDAGREYAERLATLASEVSDNVMVVMRVYFEKPRTTVGWKGLINDPNLDGTCNMAEGLRRARQFLMGVCEIGLPCATEFLDPFTPQYIADLISWGAIGARTAESQTHRQLASGLSMPIGFKNGTGGSIQLAVDGMIAASAQHAFLGIDDAGSAAVVQTSGNDSCHIVLRGGSDGPNYDAEHVAVAQKALQNSGMAPNLVVDCSHANCDKDHTKQPVAFRDVLTQRVDGNRGIVGVMLESHLNAGNQSLNGDRSSLKYGVSITDPCVDWQTTEALLREAAEVLAKEPVAVA